MDRLVGSLRGAVSAAARAVSAVLLPSGLIENEQGLFYPAFATLLLSWQVRF